MRFEHRSQLPWIVVWPLRIALMPFGLVLFAMLWTDEQVRRAKRAILGPRVGEWQRWFAWHPVTLDGGWGEVVWLETVERQGIGTSYNHAIVYQNVGEIKDPDRGTP